MKTLLISITLLPAAFILSGCDHIVNSAVSGIVDAAASAVTQSVFGGPERAMKADDELIQQKQRISAKFTSNPDTDGWHEARQKISAAMGDRDFDQGFARVFDSLTLAVADLELKVNNMERESGYLSASGMTLPPTEAKAMRKEAVVEWCKGNGFDHTVLDRQFKTSQMQQAGDMLDMSEMMARYDKMQKGLTFQLVKMGEERTKVKLRFSEVYYPGEVETYYKVIWQAVDKQIFVDETIEGEVAKRQ